MASAPLGGRAAAGNRPLRCAGSRRRRTAAVLGHPGRRKKAGRGPARRWPSMRPAAGKPSSAPLACRSGPIAATAVAAGRGTRRLICRARRPKSDAVPAENVLQKLTLSQDADGSQRLSGWVRLRLAAGQRSGVRPRGLLSALRPDAGVVAGATGRSAGADPARPNSCPTACGWT